MRFHDWRQEVDNYLQANVPELRPEFIAPLNLGAGEMLVGFPRVQAEWLHLVTMLLKRMERIEQALRIKS
jgi:hypothetical protein